MDPIDAIIFGTVQGLTEFLPVSSSGHLVLFQHFFGIEEPELFFDICLHAGTLVAIFFVFFQEIWSTLKTLTRLPALSRESGGLKPLFESNESIRISVLILSSTVPTGIMGVLFHEIADRLFSNVALVGGMLLITGGLLWITKSFGTTGRSIREIGIKDSLIIGFVQGLAILPGISRSGATISTALILGIDREVAGRYSFLLSIPAILGAMVMGFESGLLEKSSASPAALTGGTLVAAFVGYLALKILLKIIKHGRLFTFSPYCWTVGILTLILSWL